MSPALLFLVTTSSFQEWVICAPAAFLRCGSRFSGSLSDIKPRFLATRKQLGWHITNLRYLIGQTLERYVAGTRPCDQHKVIQIHQSLRGKAPIGFDLIKALVPIGSEFIRMY